MSSRGVPAVPTAVHCRWPYFLSSSPSTLFATGESPIYSVGVNLNGGRKYCKGVLNSTRRRNGPTGTDRRCPSTAETAHPLIYSVGVNQHGGRKYCKALQRGTGCRNRPTATDGRCPGRAERAPALLLYSVGMNYHGGRNFWPPFNGRVGRSPGAHASLPPSLGRAPQSRPAPATGCQKCPSSGPRLSPSSHRGPNAPLPPSKCVPRTGLQGQTSLLYI